MIQYNPPGVNLDNSRTLIKIKRIIKSLIAIFFPLICYPLTWTHRKKQRKTKYHVCLCGIFKNEGKILKEWIEYYLMIGVDHFYLYNNFSTDNYKEILAPYISQGKVTLVEWPVQYGQLTAYQDCLHRFGSECQWMGFIDLDEFVCFKNATSIGRWLNKFRNYPSVLICWKMFGTGGRVSHDCSKLTTEQYTACWPEVVNIGKSFVNTSYRFTFENVHIFQAESKIPGLSIPPVNEYKHFVFFWVHSYNWRRNSQVWINHYWSKSYSDYLSKIESDAMSADAFKIRRELAEKRFFYHEMKNTERDFTIQRYLIYLRQKTGLRGE